MILFHLLGGPGQLDQQLGIDPHTMLPNRTGRPISIAHGGQPIWDIIGETHEAHERACELAPAE